MHRDDHPQDAETRGDSSGDRETGDRETGDRATHDVASSVSTIVEALGAAAAAGETPALHALLRANADVVNHHRSDGWTALHLASYYGHLACVQLLLERGAHTEVRSDNATRNMPLHAAIAGECNAAVITALLDAGADYNRAAGHGVSPLHLAAARGSREIADLLIARGADPRARMDNESMPWHLADERGHGELARRLEGFAAP